MMTNGTDRDSIFVRTAHGAGWIFAWRVVTRVLGIASMLTLVRLLAPSDFGLIALATSCAMIVDAVSFIGVEDALVREKAPSRAMLDTAFTLNVLRALISALVIAALAAPAAQYLGEPALTPIILVIAAITAIEGFNNIGTVAFRRDMDFEKEFRLQILPRLAAVALSISLAIAFRSYWALVAGLVTQRLLRVGFSYVMHPYRPRFSLAAWRDLAAFSGWAWAIMVAMQISGRVESLVIGRMLGASHVGLYDTGKEIAQLPSSELVQPACYAAYSGFSQSRNAGGDPAAACLRTIAILTLVALPAGFGLSAIAAPLVRLAFGPNWLDAIPVIQALGIASAFAAFGIVCGTLLRAHGLMRLSFRITIIATPTRIATLILVIPFGGLPAAAAGIAVITILGRLGTLMITFRHFNIRLADLAQRVWRSAAALGIMACVLWSTGLGWNSTAPDSTFACASDIAAAVVVAMTAYAASVMSLWMLSGRPTGAETDAMEIAARTLSRVLARFQRS